MSLYRVFDFIFGLEHFFFLEFLTGGGYLLNALFLLKYIRNVIRGI